MIHWNTWTVFKKIIIKLKKYPVVSLSGQGFALDTV
jgi:hypothetical protein